MSFYSSFQFLIKIKVSSVVVVVILIYLQSVIVIIISLSLNDLQTVFIFHAIIYLRYRFVSEDLSIGTSPPLRSIIPNIIVRLGIKFDKFI